MSKKRNRTKDLCKLLDFTIEAVENELDECLNEEQTERVLERVSSKLVEILKIQKKPSGQDPESPLDCIAFDS